MKKVVGETKTLKEGCTLGKRVDVFKGEGGSLGSDPLSSYEFQNCFCYSYPLPVKCLILIAFSDKCFSTSNRKLKHSFEIKWCTIFFSYVKFIVVINFYFWIFFSSFWFCGMQLLTQVSAFSILSTLF